MDLELIKHLAELSKLEFDDEALEKMAEEMTDIIALMDTVKSVDVGCDLSDDKSFDQFNDLRSDEVKPSMSSEDVLKNALHRDSAFVSPKVVE